MVTLSIVIAIVFGYFLGRYHRSVGPGRIWRSLKKALPRRLDKRTYRGSLRLSQVLRRRPKLFLRLSGQKPQPEKGT